MPLPEPPRWSVLCVPKQGNGEDEYEDAWAVAPERGRYAVADGASESSFAGRWAQLLTEAFLTAPQPPDLAEWLAPPRRTWSAEVMGLELPWFAEMKREQGAFATFLGLGVRPPTAERAGKWRALAVGDSCLIRVRRDGQIRSFPIQKASDFGNQPRLLGSRGGPPPAPDHAAGTLAVGDRLLLMTDALAQWFLHAHESGGRPWEAAAAVLSAKEPDEAFAGWIEELRRRDEMRNDDVTLVSLEFGPEPTPTR